MAEKTDPAALTDGAVVEANALLARSAVWRLLSQALAYPSVLGLQQLLEEDFPLALAVSAPLPQDVRGTLERAAESFDGTEVEPLEEVYRDTLSHVNSRDCPVFETDFSSREIWRQSQELADIAGFYRAFGMDYPHERPDHVSLETEFLHLVSYKSAWALVQGDAEHAELCISAERRFLIEHAFRWMPAFAARFETLMPQGPYKALGGLVRAFLRSEAERLGVEVDEGVEPRPIDLEALALEETALCEQEEA